MRTPSGGARLGSIRDQPPHRYVLLLALLWPVALLVDGCVRRDGGLLQALAVILLVVVAFCGVLLEDSSRVGRVLAFGAAGFLMLVSLLGALTIGPFVLPAAFFLGVACAAAPPVRGAGGLAEDPAEPR